MIDLTKRRYEVLKKAINLANGNDDFDYVFTDVNCRLKVVFKDKRSSSFNDIDDLKKLLEDRISSFKELVKRFGGVLRALSNRFLHK